MSYFVSHMPSVQRARVHKGACKLCREGQGEANPTGPAGATGWSRPFATLLDARAYMMKTFPKYKSLGMCQTCKP